MVVQMLFKGSRVQGFRAFGFASPFKGSRVPEFHACGVPKFQGLRRSRVAF
jgi:hypothetical protein